jgi:hypothetical protein
MFAINVLRDIGGCAYAVYMCMKLDVLVIYSIALVFLFFL